MKMKQDIYDDAPWTEADIADLKASIAANSSLAETAGFLCRAGSEADVARKAHELGLQLAEISRRAPPD